MERIVEERYHSSMFPQRIRERIGADRVVKVTIEDSDADEREAAAFDQAVILAVADLDDGKGICAEAVLVAFFARFAPPSENVRADGSLKLHLAPAAEASLHNFGAETRSVRPDSASTEFKTMIEHFLEKAIEGYSIQVFGIDDLIITHYRSYYVTHRLKDNTREIIRISMCDHDVKGYRFQRKLTALEWSKLGVDVTYPVAVIEDRYSGTYSGGRWLAIAGADAFENGLTRIARCVESGPGPSGDDGEAMDFWNEAPDWIAVGDTADAAIDNLRKRVLSQEASEI